MSQQLTPAQFIAKWSPVTLSERAASQEHFIDLCRMLGQPTPVGHDPTGEEYSFEKGNLPTGEASKGSAGKYGFADVWWRGKFAWEYKRKDKHKDLAAAYGQLLKYREALENPPLLIVCDIARTEIHTNFTGTAKVIHPVRLEDLAKPGGLDLLRRVFDDPLSFKPDATRERVTEEIAKRFSTLAQSLRSFEHDAITVAHFLMKCMFCLFAEDVDLLPRDLFSKLIESYRKDPAKLADRMTELFGRMRTGGDFGVEPIKHFNGGLFDQAPALRLTSADIDILLAAARSDWASVEPAIFGTLFERSLDPNTRATMIGAHYTSRDDIMLVVEPVIMAPLRREWEAVKAKCEQLISKLGRKTMTGRGGRALKQSPVAAKIERLLVGFLDRLAAVRVLDPACGSGNFLYVAVQQLLTLEKEVITFAGRPQIAMGRFPGIRPTQLLGIEINHYAAELAQVVIWIGYLQWMRDNGFIAPSSPVLEPLQTIECRDAILDRSDPDSPKPAKWPEADFIIGNPPFLGSKLFRKQGLPDSDIAAMYAAFDLPNPSDLCCYWFELARRTVERKTDTRVGLLATQGIRGGANRTVLERIKQSGDIFLAWSDKEWILDGAAVHVSIVGFGRGSDDERHLDGVCVDRINANLTSGVDIARAVLLHENKSIAFMGDTKVGPFEIDAVMATKLLRAPNVNGSSNADVVRPWINGLDLTRRWRSMWIIDFPPGTALQQASQYELPFEHICENVRPMRKDARSGDATGVPWWIHQRPRPEMRNAIARLQRYIVTPTLTKHRLFSWRPKTGIPDHQLIAFARSDDYFFGVLHSSIHELWARRMGTQLREAESGFRYTPTSCFETFPLPWPPGEEPESHEAYKRIAAAAKELNDTRERWLNPPEWIDPIAKAVDANDDFADVPEEAREMIRQSAIMARAAKDPKLKKRTLTNLYNERPTWLRLLHDKLDRAVLAAYAAIDAEGDWCEDWAEVWIETGAGFRLPENHHLLERREEIDQLVLANLLRLNLQRSESK